MVERLRSSGASGIREGGGGGGGVTLIPSKERELRYERENQHKRINGRPL